MTKKRQQQKGKTRKPKDGSEDDIIIPVMGPTGVGKSTFINIAAGQDRTLVGHDLTSCTAEIQAVRVNHPRFPSRRIVFVDTPGFDDTYVSDTEILRRIANWLKDTYTDDKKLSGIIYLHDISQARMLGSLRHNFQMFNKLCGNEAARNVILVTTKWDQVAKPTGESRERQLENSFWQDILRVGSRNLRFRASKDSAWQIVDAITERTSINDVFIQRELVDLMKILPETDAGNALRFTLKELLETYKSAANQIRRDEKEANSQDEKQRLADVEERLRGTIAQIKEMRVPLSRRILKFLGLV